ncbi:hypothetical protein Tco_1345644 [Tanacetum coccineum]
MENPRKLNHVLNKTNFISEPINNALVKHSVRNAKFEFICAICNECMFDANHDKCVLDYVHDVNVFSKSKTAKCKNKKRTVWKPIVPLKETTIAPVITPTSELKVYSRKPKATRSIALCYPTNDGEDLGKLKPKADIGIFVGYAPAKKAL